MNLKQRLKMGETANGIMLSELYTPNIVRILAGCGYDFLLIDCEHGYFDLSQTANLIAVAQGVQLPVWIRVPSCEDVSIAKYLDMGAQGILLADAGNAAAARRLVARCLYAPKGARGVSTFRAHTNYCHGDMKQIMHDANARVVVVAQVESPRAVRDIDDILSVEGMDGVLIGPNDLTQHMDMIGQYNAPIIEQMLARVAAAAKAGGKWAGIITADERLLTLCKRFEMTCFSSGSELNALAFGAKQNINSLRMIDKNTRE